MDQLDLSPWEKQAPEGVLTTERNVFFLSDDLDWPEPIPCTEDFADEAMEAGEDEVLSVELDTEEALENFREGCYAVHGPLCLVTDDGQRLEAALRVYQGLACCRADCGVSPEELEVLRQRYGLVII